MSRFLSLSTATEFLNLQNVMDKDVGWLSFALPSASLVFNKLWAVPSMGLTQPHASRPQGWLWQKNKANIHSRALPTQGITDGRNVWKNKSNQWIWLRRIYQKWTFRLLNREAGIPVMHKVVTVLLETSKWFFMWQDLVKPITYLDDMTKLK